MPVDSPLPPSSSTAADRAVFSLRDRLRSEDASQPFQPGSPVCEEVTNDFYTQLRANFDTVTNTSEDNTATAKLSDALACAGKEIHDSSLQAIQSAHQHVASKIKVFQSQASATHACTHSLYENISHRLSATVCHSQSFPRASVGRHILSMQKSIAASRNELDRLHTEWERCLREEAAIIKEKPPAENLDARQTLDKLVMQAEGIVADKADKLDEMDQKYRDLLWTESNKLMEAMMAD